MSRLSLGPLHGFKRDPQPSPTHATFGLPHLVSQTWLLPNPNEPNRAQLTLHHVWAT
ncbi:hypothetical protein PIB30_101570, partial [Stylosanthes scabra]|nr:hypothetical protein [Stylosanthes scabra]